jgi:hypothetical protein
MSPHFRKALAWLLLAFLPLQGYAAAAMVSCHADGSAHAAHDMAQHDHAGAHDAAMEPEASPAAAHTCSACASCCMGVAAAAPATSFASLPVLNGFAIPFHDVFEADGVPRRLERPPRLALA